MLRDNKVNLTINTNPKSAFIEAIKTVRTNLHFSSVNKEVKVILVTSPEPGDGKSFISANLAGAYAQENKRVLIIDCDLRKGRQAEIFKIRKMPTTGYTNLILNYNDTLDDNEEPDKFSYMELSDYIEKTAIKRVDLIPNGPTPPNPIELLSSAKNRKIISLLKNKYDIIILDCPPALGLSDTLIMTRFSDVNIVTISSRKTKIELLNEVKKNFEKANAKITGVVINKAKIKHNSYYGYYGE